MIIPAKEDISHKFFHNLEMSSKNLTIYLTIHNLYIAIKPLYIIRRVHKNSMPWFKDTIFKYR